jgi:hypothetical protein
LTPFEITCARATRFQREDDARRLVDEYYVFSPTLRAHLLLEDRDWWGTVELCGVYLGRFDALPLGEWLGQTDSLANHSQELPERDDPPPYHKFLPNMNIPFAHDQCVENLEMRPIWLAEWHVHLLTRIGEHNPYECVYLFPNAHGFSWPTFLPGVEGMYTPEELTEHEDTDDYSMEIRCTELPQRHPLRVHCDVTRRLVLWQDWFRARRIALYWHTRTSHLYGEGGVGRRRDRDAFERECKAICWRPPDTPPAAIPA